MADKTKQTADTSSDTGEGRDGSVTHELIGGPLRVVKGKSDAVELRELVFTPPNAGMLMDAEGVTTGEIGQLVALLAQMAGVPLQDFRKIHLVDLKAIIAKTDHMTGNGFGGAGGDGAASEDGAAAPSL